MLPDRLTEVDPPLRIDGTVICLFKYNKKRGNMVMFRVATMVGDDCLAIDVPSLARARLLRNNIVTGYNKSKDLKGEFKKWAKK